MIRKVDDGDEERGYWLSVDCEIGSSTTLSISTADSAASQ